MRFQRIHLYILAGLIVLGFGSVAQILQAQQESQPEIVPSYLVPLYAKSSPDVGRVLPRPDLQNSVQSATITVSYNGFTPEAQAAFQYAVDIWAREISSPIPIHIVAHWTNLGPGVLGSAGPTDFVATTRNGQVTYYPIALASKLDNRDYKNEEPYKTGFETQYGVTADIEANFNSALSLWYFGTDGNTPPSRYDFVSVVLHELGHGLGFIGGFYMTSSSAYWYRPAPFVYDRFTVDDSGNSLINTSLYPVGSTSLGNALKSNNVYFTGPNAMLGAGGEKVKLFAPSIWYQGSSYSHLDETTYYTGSPNALMTPSLDDGEALHDVGDITRGILKDLGWMDGTEQPFSSPPPSQTLTPSITRTPIPPGTIFENYLPYVPNEVPTSQATLTPTFEWPSLSPTFTETAEGEETPSVETTPTASQTMTMTMTITETSEEEEPFATLTATATLEDEEAPIPSFTPTLTASSPLDPDGSPSVTPTKTIEITGL